MRSPVPALAHKNNVDFGMTKYLTFAAIVALLVVLGLMIGAQSQSQFDKIRNVSSSGPAQVFAVGRVEGVTGEIELRPQVDGICGQLLVAEGQAVRRGQVLLRLDDAQQRHEVELACAELDLVEAQLERLRNGARRQQRAEAASQYRAALAELEHAQLVLTRVEQLRAAQAIPRQEADDQRTRVKSLQAQLDAAKARLELIEAPARPDEVRMAQARVSAAKARLALARTQLDRTKLRAPCEGQILQISIERGEILGPGSADPAIIFADTSNYRVRAFVEELDARRIKVNMTAAVVPDGIPSREYQGRVVRLRPRMGPKTIWGDRPTERYDTKTREVWIELDQASDLVVGLRVDVLIDVPANTQQPDPESVASY